MRGAEPVREGDGATEAVAVRVEGLTLGPPGRGSPVLVDACLTLGAGRVLAVVGRSGSGKSSLALALLGHVRQRPRPDGGRRARR
ncbi:ATP-binding cassette domain-containing protein, partial [Streptomyces sp. SPB074]|uniref:ATP-binding cassette domain-containing protein n=1 Tax=Streptomyces sp. (strain SPB074) TaxID=465543 RepID=UPI0018F8925C